MFAWFETYLTYSRMNIFKSAFTINLINLINFQSDFKLHSLSPLLFVDFSFQNLLTPSTAYSINYFRRRVLQRLKSLTTSITSNAALSFLSLQFIYAGKLLETNAINFLIKWYWKCARHLMVKSCVQTLGYKFIGFQRKIISALTWKVWN